MIRETNTSCVGICAQIYGAHYGYNGSFHCQNGTVPVTYTVKKKGETPPKTPKIKHFYGTYYGQKYIRSAYVPGTLFLFTMFGVAPAKIRCFFGTPFCGVLSHTKCCETKRQVYIRVFLSLSCLVTLQKYFIMIDGNGYVVVASNLLTEKEKKKEGLVRSAYCVFTVQNTVTSKLKGGKARARGFEWVLMKFLLCLLCALVFFVL